MLLNPFNKLFGSHSDLTIFTEAVKLVNNHTFLNSDTGSLPLGLIGSLDMMLVLGFAE